MSPDNLTVINPPSVNGDEATPPASSVSGAQRKAPTAWRPLEPPPPQKCPRCESPNTKFCYYNNYSLTQPRHFCKTCRRYWTKGGALRNVPIGGGCRKNKKVSTKSSSSRLSSSDSKHSAESSPYSDIGGFKLFSNLSPAMDFHLGGLNSNFTRFQSPGSGSNKNFIHHNQNYPASFGDISTPVATLNSGFAIDPNATNAGDYLMGFNYAGLKPDHGNVSGFGSGLMPEFGGTTTSTNNNRNNLASIESLSSMNQDLHWKLQQERLAVLFGGGADININNNNNNINVNNNNNGHVQKPQPILFENLEINSSKSAGDYQHHVVGGGGAVESRKDATTNGSDHGGFIGSLATEWYFDKFSSFAPAMNPTPTTSSSTSNGIHGWNGNFDQYTTLP